MVRFKVRWACVEMLMEDGGARRHPIQIPDILTAIFSCISDSFGDFGVGKVSKSLKVEYYSSRLNIFLVRCAAPHISLLLSSLAFITSMGSRSVCLRVLHVSGTLVQTKKELERCMSTWVVKRSRELLDQLESERVDDDRRHVERQIRYLEEEAVAEQRGIQAIANVSLLIPLLLSIGHSNYSDEGEIDVSPFGHIQAPFRLWLPSGFNINGNSCK